MSRYSENRDGLYATNMEKVEDFVFDSRVAAVFPDMISRSVPGYATIIAMTGMLAANHAVAGSNLYDLGCSLGAACASMSSSLEQPGCTIIGVDKAPAMVITARDNLRSEIRDNIKLVCADIEDVAIVKATVVVLNFTLQFLPVSRRLALLKKIRRGMLPSGVLILSEKISGATDAENKQLVALHHMFKRANGYSDLEISQKRAALENVLLPEPITVHQQRLRDAGFSRVQLWFQCFNFVSFIAQP